MIQRRLHRLAWLGSLCVLTLFVMRCQRVEKQEGNDSIRIGVIASLTGAASDQGIDWMQGARLAAEELQAKGIPVELIVEDDATQPRQAVSSFQQLLAISKVDAVMGGTWDFLADALYPLVKENKLPLLLPTNPYELVDRVASDNPWVLSNAMTLHAEKQALSKLFGALEVKRVALLVPNLAWGWGHADIIRALGKSQDFTIVFDEQFSFESYLDSLRVSLLRALRENPDVIYAPIDAPGMTLIVKECARMHVAPYLVASQHLHRAVQATNAPALFERTFGVYPKVFGETFSEAYRRSYGVAPEVYAESGYDGVGFLVALLQQRITVSDKPRGFRWNGIAGGYRLFEGSSRVLESDEATIFTVRDGALVEWAPKEKTAPKVKTE